MALAALNLQPILADSISGGAVAAAVAVFVFAIIQYAWPRAAADRYKWGLAFAVGVFIGWVALPSTTVLVPTQFWDRIPYLGLLAAAIAGLVRADGVLRGERWATQYCIALLAAWLMVPDWPDMTPVWPIQFAALAAAIFTATVLLSALPTEQFGRSFLSWLTIAAAVTFVCVAVDADETIGRVAVLPVGALAGCVTLAAFGRTPPDWRGIVLPYAVVVGGYAYAGAIFPVDPQWAVVALPAAPLALWLCTRGPLSRFLGVRAILIQAACVAVPLAIVVAVLLNLRRDLPLD